MTWEDDQRGLGPDFTEEAKWIRDNLEVNPIQSSDDIPRRPLLDPPPIEARERLETPYFASVQERFWLQCWNPEAEAWQDAGVWEAHELVALQRLETLRNGPLEWRIVKERHFTEVTRVVLDA